MSNQRARADVLDELMETEDDNKDYKIEEDEGVIVSNRDRGHRIRNGHMTSRTALIIQKLAFQNTVFRKYTGPKLSAIENDVYAE